MTDDRIVAFRDALRDGDAAGAIENFDGFDDAVDEQANRESALRDVARGVVARVPSKRSEHQTAQRFLRAVTDAQEARLEAKYDFALHLEGGPDAAAVADRVDDVLGTTADVEDVADDLRDDVSGIELPPAIAVNGPSALVVPKGTSIQATYTASNLGVESASDLEITVEGHDLSPNPDGIDTLAAGEDVSIAVTGDADEAIEEPLVVTVGAESSRTDLRIVDKSGFLRRALTVLGEVEDRLEQIYETRNDGSRGNGNGKKNGKNKGNGNSPGRSGLENKLETARKRIERLADEADGGKTGDGDALDERIESVTKLLGAFMNQVQGLSNNQLSDRDASLLTADATVVIDELTAATDAAV